MISWLGYDGAIMRIRTLLVVALLVLAFLGLADSWYLAESAYMGTDLTCDIEGLDGCNTVAQSPYSWVFGIPLAAYGVGYYGLLFVVGAFLLTRRDFWLYQGALALGMVGLLASIYFLYLQLAVIKATCIYCLASFVIASLIALIAWILYRKAKTPIVVP